MRKCFLIITFAVAACNNNSSDPADHLSKKDMDDALWEIVHYAAKRPPGALPEIVFDKEFEEYYRSVVTDYKWLHVRPNESNGYYFLISRPARSITPMVEGIAGSFRMQADSLVEYEEIFRMWKMPAADLDVKGKAMFDRMVAGNDLSVYYPKFTGDQYIEVPDGKFVYDNEKRQWLDTTGPDLE
jgi:hypothetical protein